MIIMQIISYNNKRFIKTHYKNDSRDMASEPQMIHGTLNQIKNANTTLLNKIFKTRLH